MSRFKNMKFDVTCDSNGTNCWVPIEQAKSLLCDAMSVESENKRLRRAGDVLSEIVWDDNASLDSIMKACENWKAAKEGKSE